MLAAEAWKERLEEESCCLVRRERARREEDEEPENLNIVAINGRESVEWWGMAGHERRLRHAGSA